MKMHNNMENYSNSAQQMLQTSILVIIKLDVNMCTIYTRSNEPAVLATSEAKGTGPASIIYREVADNIFGCCLLHKHNQS